MFRCSIMQTVQRQAENKSIQKHAKKQTTHAHWMETESFLSKARAAQGCPERIGWVLCLQAAVGSGQDADLWRANRSG